MWICCGGFVQLLTCPLPLLKLCWVLGQKMRGNILRVLTVDEVVLDREKVIHIHGTCLEDKIIREIMAISL